MKNAAGVYEIANTANGKRYIGSTVNFALRWREHRRTLRLNKHHNALLQRAWNKYGEAAFVFRIILGCSPVKETLLEAEQKLLDSEHPAYNINKKADSCLGIKRRPEVCARISAGKKGKSTGPRPPSFGAAISKARKGKPLAPDQAARAREQCRKMTLLNQGRKFSDAHRVKCSIAQQGNKKALGMKHTIERNAAISARLTGKKRAPFSIEWRRKLGNANRGKPKPLEWRAMMSAKALLKIRRSDGTFMPKGTDEHA
ncbi:MAG: GIY-YIG nuclease family protein [Sulfuricaulis sp.]|nr:GIY-YIG nuclease family protein [Sulfuricaulis sp.]